MEAAASTLCLAAKPTRFYKAAPFQIDGVSYGG
jgi:hypothetical protein